MDKIECRYSGPLSRQFWKRVNALFPGDAGKVAYGLGCSLQNLEAEVLQYLREAELRAKKLGRVKR